MKQDGRVAVGFLAKPYRTPGIYIKMLPSNIPSYQMNFLLLSPLCAPTQLKNIPENRFGVLSLSIDFSLFAISQQF